MSARPRHGRSVPSLALPLVVAAALLVAASARAETLVEAHRRALADYYAGRYDRAAEGLERIAGVPIEHEDLHYNLGCAYFKQSKLGPAIYHFERALALDAGDEDARFNLETARALVASRVKDEIKGAAGDAWWARALSILSPRSWTVLLLVFWWITLGAIFILRYLGSGPLRAGMVAGTSCIGLLTVLCALGVGGHSYQAARVPTAIVLPDQLEVREGPDATTRVSFRVHAGLRVRLRDRSEDWSRIRLANGLEGWVQGRELGAL